MKIGQFNTIRKRLTFWLLLIALIPLFISLVSTYVQRADEINTDTYNKLSTIRNLKVQQLKTWINSRIGEVHFISRGMELRNLEFVSFDGQQSSKDKKLILAAQKLISRDLIDFKDFSEISFINAKTGIIEISTRPEFIGLNQKANSFYSEPLKNGGLYIKDIHHSDITNKHEMTLSAPVYCSSHNRHVIGILMVRINLSNSLYALLNNRVGLGETGETLIVNKNGLALNELRWYDDAPLNLKINAAPALAAVGGETGVIQDLDYRGEPVLAAFTYIEETQWGFVCKQDLYELEAPIRKMLRNFIVIFLVITLICLILSFYIGKSIAKPIVSIHNVAQKIKSGDFSVRNTVESNDELGLLSKEFNNMADFTESKIKIQQGVSEISNTIINQSSMHSFGNEILKSLMKITKANMAVFYVLNEESQVFEHFTSIGANEELLQSFNAENLEGELGNALVHKDIYYIKQIPDNTIFKFNTSAGQIVPKEIISIPVLVENSVVALVSLVNISEFVHSCIEIIKESWLSINTAYSSLLSNERTSVLAENLAHMNHQLEAQSEELRSSTEELYDQNLELDEQRKKVEAANRLKSEFLSNMSHELRTPLNSINTLSQVLIAQSKGKLNADEANYLEIIERNGKNLLALINDILDLSRIEAGKMEIEPQPVLLNSLLVLVKDILSTMAEKKGLSILLDVEENLPSIESDEMRLHQVLLNIVGNAVKFTDEGTIKISAKSHESNVIIKVEDTGIGIAEDMLPYIFDEFRQVDGSASRQYEGTGLGLAIAHKLIKILGGDIVGSSIINVGTTFTLTVPIKWHNKSQVSKKVKPIQSSVDPNKKTILVVEDNLKVANEISAYLNEEGFAVQIAQTADEALYYATSFRYYAITLDIYMPEIDGWELLQKLKEDTKTKDIPVIVVTVSTDKSTAFALGALGYVSKPIVKESLLQEIFNIDKAPRSILIIDDNEIELNEMAAMLKGEHIETVTAKNGIEGLALLDVEKPDLLILDLMMPEMDGFQVLHELRNKPETQYLSVIIVSAKNLSVKDKALLSGQVSSIIAKSEDTISKLNVEINRIIKNIEVSKTLGKPYVNDRINILPTVLIVEDNMDNMTTFKAVLSKNYSIVEAMDGEQGLNSAIDLLPDLVLLDMSLPKLNGEKVVRLMKENKQAKHIPVIAVSAKVMKGDKEKFLKAGCDDFVPKPIDATELIDKIEKWLAK